MPGAPLPWSSRAGQTALCARGAAPREANRICRRCWRELPRREHRISPGPGLCQHRASRLSLAPRRGLEDQAFADLIPGAEGMVRAVVAATPAVRRGAAAVLLDLGWGKRTQPLAGRGAATVRLASSAKPRPGVRRRPRPATLRRAGLGRWSFPDFRRYFDICSGRRSLVKGRRRVNSKSLCFSSGTFSSGHSQCGGVAERLKRQFAKPL